MGCGTREANASAHSMSDEIMRALDGQRLKATIDLVIRSRGPPNSTLMVMVVMQIRYLLSFIS